MRFLPAINEELGGTAVLGTQRVESDPERTVEGVFAMWYGKGPGVDRAGDALKHGNAYGSSPHGGVLVVAGDDHGCVSSSMPHQSDFAMMAWHMPVVNPSNIADMLEFGLYGWALSRFSGAWVGYKAISETVESGSTVDLDALQTDMGRAAGFRRARGRPAQPLARSAEPDDRSAARREARRRAPLRAREQHRQMDRAEPARERGDRDVRQGASGPDGNAAPARSDRRRSGRGGRADLQGRPVVSAGDDACSTRSSTGLSEVLVIEEKGPVIEQQIKDYLYNRTHGARPIVIGKHAQDGTMLLSSLGELRPSRVLPVFAELARAAQAGARSPRTRGRSGRAANPLERRRFSVKRTPYFCSGCPHNTSTKVPEGSIAQAGIGCHFMASWMERDTTGLIQMGGEGVDWASHSMFTKTRARLPESRRRHLFPLGHSRDPPGGRGESHHHLQDSL